MDFEKFNQEQKLNKAFFVTEEDADFDTETLFIPGKARIELYDVTSTSSDDQTERTLKGKDLETDSEVMVISHTDSDKGTSTILEVTIAGETVYNIRQ